MNPQFATDVSPRLDFHQLMPTLESYLLRLPEVPELPGNELSDNPDSSTAYDEEWSKATLSENSRLQDRVAIAPETFVLDSGDVLRTRNALKLATKFFSEHRLPWGLEQSIDSCAHVAEVGTLLAIANVHPEIIQAGFLYPTMVAGERIDTERAQQAIEKKFGPEVLRLVSGIKDLLELSGEELTLSLLDTQAHDPLFARRLATLHCAVICARSPSEENLPSLSRTYVMCGVSTSLLNQFHLDGGRSTHIVPANQDDSPYSLHDTIDIRNALRSAAVVFQDSLRKWGPSEKIPLISHAAEVGLLLILTGRSRDTVVAGLLHDFLEGYAEGKISSLMQVVEQYGRSVRKMVLDITEPNRRAIHGKEEDRDSWFHRKLEIVRRMSEGSTEFSELVSATKISTLAAGNKMLFENAPFNKWSNGSCHDNIGVFNKLRETCGEKKIHPLLAEQLNIEIDRLIQQAARMQPVGEQN